MSNYKKYHFGFSGSRLLCNELPPESLRTLISSLAVIISNDNFCNIRWYIDEGKTLVIRRLRFQGYTHVAQII